MADQNDKLGEFLRKQFATTPEPEDSAWFRPDPGVREALLQQIHDPPSPRRRWLGLLLVGGGILTAIFLSSLLFSLQGRVDALERQLAERSVISEQVLVDTPIIRRTEFTQPVSLSPTVDKVILPSTTPPLAIAAPTVAVGGSRADFMVYINRKRYARSLARQRQHDSLATIVRIRPTPPLAKASLSGVTQAYNYGNNLQGLSVVPVHFPTFRRTKRPVFEAGLGYQASVQSFQVVGHFDNLRTVSSEPENTRLVGTAPGVNLAFSPIRNWWVRMGLTAGEYQLSHRTVGEFGYSARDATRAPNGDIITPLSLRTTTSFSETTAEVNLITAQGRRLEEGTPLRTVQENDFDYTYLKVPLGIERSWGKGKLSWLGAVGAQWNQVRLERHAMIVNLEGASRALRIAETDPAITPATESLTYFSAYGSLGLNYRLGARWHVRTLLTGERSLSALPKITDRPVTGITLQLGTYRRF